MARKTAKSDDPPPPKYQDCLRHLFGRDEDEDLFGLDCNLTFPCSDQELVALFTHTMANCGEDLIEFSDGQLGRGLDILFNNSIADYSVDIRQTKVDAQTLMEALLSIKSLYSDCLAQRAPHVLGHLSETQGSPLEFICYMLWDITPLSYWKDAKHEDAAYRAILAVMEDALYTGNEACIESGLHGLGHNAYDRPEQVSAIIERFLTGNPAIRPELRRYAESAATGCIQ